MTPFLHNSPVLIVGEAPGDKEVSGGHPFLGASGMELNSMLIDAGFPIPKAKYPSDLKYLWMNQREVSLTNVFHEQPPKNDLTAWRVLRKGTEGNRVIPVQGGVVDPARSNPAIARLQREISQVSPNLILCVGNTPLAALCGVSGIAKLRGAIHVSASRKVIPTYHPAAVLRNYELRPAVIADLIKARRESAFPDLRVRNRKLHINPELADLPVWKDRLLSAPSIAFDIETRKRQITCIGFAISPEEVFVIPFWNVNGENYWKTPEEEAFAYKIVREIMEGPAVKIAHNGIYDVQYLYRYGIAVKNFTQDTMLFFHALYPALPKALGFLGSIYCNEKAWKQWRVRGSDTHELKREE